MKNKLLFSILFMFLIFLILGINSISSAFTFEIDGKTYNIEELGFTLLDYNIVFTDPYSIKIFTSSSPGIINGNNLSFTSNTYSYEYLNSKKNWYTHSYNTGVSFTGFKNNSNINLYYLNYDVLDSEGNLVIEKMNSDGSEEEPSYTYFNFTYNDKKYSLNVTHDTLRDYISIFKVGNYAILFTSDDKPSYKYIDNTDYLHTTSFTNLYLYNLSTGDNVLYSSSSAPSDFIEKYTGYFENGTDFAFHTDNLIYSNFILYDKNGNVVFRPSELTLASVLSSTEPEKILSEIITLLPVIMGLIVSYLALRKAIRELLRKAQI